MRLVNFDLPDVVSKMNSRTAFYVFPFPFPFPFLSRILSVFRICASPSVRFVAVFQIGRCTSEYRPKSSLRDQRGAAVPEHPDRGDPEHCPFCRGSCEKTISALRAQRWKEARACRYDHEWAPGEIESVRDEIERELVRLRCQCEPATVGSSQGSSITRSTALDSPLTRR